MTSAVLRPVAFFELCVKVVLNLGDRRDLMRRQCQCDAFSTHAQGDLQTLFERHLIEFGTA